MRTSSQVSVKSSVSDLVMILFLSQCSTPCQSPMPPAWNRPGHEQHEAGLPSHYLSSQPPVLTCYQHEDGGGRDVGGRGFPAAEDASREGDEHEEEANNEENNKPPLFFAQIQN